MAITVSTEIAAPVEEVWEHAIDFASHVEWMADAESIEFLTDDERGGEARPTGRRAASPEAGAEARSASAGGAHAQPRGLVGTTMAVETAIGPLRTTDVIEVVAIDRPHSIRVHHRGLFSGSGEFRLEPIGDLKTKFTWHESIEFPWYLGGPVGAVAAKPILAAVWRANLRRFRILIEGSLPA